MTSANCSPTTNNSVSFQNSLVCAFGTRNVQLPPVMLRGSSHTGFTPLLNKCTESFIFMAPSGNWLKTSQNGLIVMMFSTIAVSWPSLAEVERLLWKNAHAYFNGGDRMRRSMSSLSASRSEAGVWICLASRAGAAVLMETYLPSARSWRIAFSVK